MQVGNFNESSKLFRFLKTKVYRGNREEKENSSIFLTALDVNRDEERRPGGAWKLRVGWKCGENTALHLPGESN